MTVIVGLEHNDEVYIGADSAGVNAGYLTINTHTDPKVFKNKTFIFGYTCSFRMGQILNYLFDPPTHKKNVSDLKYLCGPFVKEIKYTFGDHEYTLPDESDELFLMGYNKKLYYVDKNFQISQIDCGFHSVGCGSQFAFGAMNSNQHLKDPTKRIIQALETAEKFSAGVRGPFHVIKL